MVNENWKTHVLWIWSAFSAAALSIATPGCAGESPEDDRAAGTGGTSTGGIGNTATTGGSGTGGASGDFEALPVAVDDFFKPSGYMEDAQNTALMMGADPGDDPTCGGNRAPGARGVCHKVTYLPPKGTALGWGGVFWQYPANNWGSAPGLFVEAGATKIRWMARGETGMEKVGFFAGIHGTSGEPYQDAFPTVENPARQLSTEWQEYSLTLPPSDYSASGIIGAFAWGVAEADNATFTGPMTFYIDDITIER